MIKAFGFGLFTIAGNVLAGAYVFEITETNGKVQFLDWRDSTRSHAFWALVFVLVFLGLYSWGMARYETTVRTALTQSDVRNRVVEKLLDPLLNQVEKQIDEGKITSMYEVMRICGVEPWGRE